jgi:hypothetical protein
MGPFRMSSCSSCVGQLRAAETCYLWYGMGQLNVLKNTAHSLEWAHCSSLEMLPIIWNGPNVAAYKCCQWSCMGPFQLPKNAAYDLEWAHGSCLKMLPMI